MTLKGIDLSGWQKTTPSLTGLAFAFVKATEGTTFKDPMYATHTAAAVKAGIVHGAYHYGSKLLDPAAQARFLVATAPDAQLYVLDSEGTNRMSDAQEQAFFAALRAARPGVKCGLYESLSGYDQNVGQDFNWIAAWGSTAPSIPWTFWQYTSSGSVPGYTGRLDLNLFNGDQAALDALAGIEPPLAPAPPRTLGPKPAGATGWVSVNGAFFRWLSSTSREARRGRYSAWAKPIGLAWQGERVTGYQVMSGAYKGYRIFAGPGVTWHGL